MAAIASLLQRRSQSRPATVHTTDRSPRGRPLSAIRGGELDGCRPVTSSTINGSCGPGARAPRHATDALLKRSAAGAADRGLASAGEQTRGDTREGVVRGGGGQHLGAAPGGGHGGSNARGTSRPAPAPLTENPFAPAGGARPDAGGLGGAGEGLDKSPIQSFAAERVIGSGAFGVVYQAQNTETGETVAIKKVLQDSRYKNRELEMMQELRHPNIVELKQAFYLTGARATETYLNVVMEYCPDTVDHVMKHYAKMRQQVPSIFVCLYSYQILRGVGYMHAVEICHRDIKPHNLLVDSKTHAVKVCDFGSAKRLVKGEVNTAYICSRFYRAPELIFGATEYTTLIDIWSVACVIAELLTGRVLFPGDSAVDQLMEIIKVLGTPTREDLMAMNPDYGEFKFPQVKAHPWAKVFRQRSSPEMIDLLSKVLQYNPAARPNGLQACAHPYFDGLREEGSKILGTKPMPPYLHWFSREEMALMTPELKAQLVPDWAPVDQEGVWPPARPMGNAVRPSSTADPSMMPKSPMRGSSALGASRGRRSYKVPHAI